MPSKGYPTLSTPSREEVATLATQYGLSFTDEEIDDYTSLLADAIDDIDQVFRYDDPKFGIHQTDYSRQPPGETPTDDPLNTWLLRCQVTGADSGLLTDKTIGVKDNIALAGYEMTCGSHLMKGYVPQIDATVVTRVLDAGGSITGKLNMEAFAWSGSSDIADFGTVPNPHDETRLAGGSSSGCGTAVATGDCDIAIGSDQGGSIRIPAAWCGVVGVKPTTGLVPYTGAFPLDPTIDHLGPLTRTVREAAEALTVIAGDDVQDGVRMDARQPPGIEAADYTDALEQDIENVSIGVLEEGFDWKVSESSVDQCVRETLSKLETEGADLTSVSIKNHRRILSLLTPMESQGGARIIEESGVGTHHTGWNWTDLIDTFTKFKRAHTSELPPTTKLALLIDAYLREKYGISCYAKAKNLILELEKQYNELLETHDVLVMPTIPVHPFEKDESLNRIERVSRIVDNHRNTAQFDHTHHPALTVPCGTADDLPVGLQIVGKHFHESTVFRVGSAVEQISEWSLHERQSS